MIRLGIVGAGRIIQSHIDAAVIAGFHPAVICGREGSDNAKRIASANQGLLAVQNLEALLKFKLDAILIAVSPDETPAVLKSCLRANLPILVEKPVSTDPVVLNQLIELCSSQVRVGYNRRFYSSVNEIKRELTNESGIIQVVIPELSTTIGTNSNQRVNAVLENSVHMFDLLYFLFGDISIRQTASISENVNADSLMIQAQFGERFVGNIILLFENPENYSLNCWVRRKNLELKPIETLHKSIKINLLMESERLPYKRYKKNIVEWKMNEDDLIAKPGFLGMYREFIEFIHSKSSVNLATLNDALNAVNFGITLLATSYKKNDNN